MEQIRIDKKRLVDTLTINREKHTAKAVAAKEGYRLELIETLEKLLGQAKSGDKIDHNLDLSHPEDYTKEYDAVLQMLDFEQNQEVVLSNRDFRRYVLDEWDWQRSFGGSNSLYLSKVGYKD